MGYTVIVRLSILEKIVKIIDSVCTGANVSRVP